MPLEGTAVRANPVGAYAHFEDYHWWFVARRRIMQELVWSLLPASPQNLIIDVGCGTGANLASLAAEYGCLGIDTSDAAIAIARERYPMIEFVCGEAPAALGTRMAEARLVLLMDVLEHVEDDGALLRRLVHAAAPGTHFLVMVPSDPRLWSPHDDAVGHYRRYTPASLAALWESLPTTCLMLSPYNARLHLAVRTIRTVGRWLRRSHGSKHAEGTDLRVPRAPLNGLLIALFSQEAMPLARALREQAAAPFDRGVSLVAVLQRV